MKNCWYCNKELPKRQRKYCGKVCSTRFKAEGPAREQFVYKEVVALKTDLEEKIDTLTWMLFPKDYDDEQCRGDFIRVFERKPEYVVFDPRTPYWKFTGPIWTEEQQKRRWKDYGK